MSLAVPVDADRDDAPPSTTATAPLPPPRRSRKPAVVYYLQTLDDDSYQLHQYARPAPTAPPPAPCQAPAMPGRTSSSTSTTRLYHRPTHIVIPRPPPRNMYTARRKRQTLPEPQIASAAAETQQAPPTRQSARVREKAATTQPPSPRKPRQAPGGAVDDGIPKVDASPELAMPPPARRLRQRPKSARRVRVTSPHVAAPNAAEKGEAETAKPSEPHSSTETVSTDSGASPAVSMPATPPSNNLPLEVKQELVGETASPVSPVSPSSLKRKSEEEDTTDQDKVGPQPLRSRSGRIVKKRKME